MKHTFHNLRRWCLVSLGLFAVLGLAAQESENAEPAALRERAFTELENGSYARAQPLFAELAEAAEPGSFEALEAAWYADFSSLVGELERTSRPAWEPLPEDPWGRRRRALEQRAEALRTAAPAAERWLRLHVELGRLQTQYLWADAVDNLGAYQTVFEHWADSTDLETARAAYLDLVGTLAERRELRHELHQQLLPYVENAAALARDPADVQRFQWLWAHFLARYADSPNNQLRRGTALRQALLAGEQNPTPYYARALLDHGEWASDFGVSFYGENGDLQFRPSYEDAGRSYRRLLELDPGERTPAQREEAESRLEWIEQPELAVMVPENFRPETNIHFWVSWRNLERPVIRVYPLEPEQVANGFFAEFRNLEMEGRSVLEERALSDEPEAPHYTVRTRLRLETQLPEGAYLVEARSGEELRRELLLVSDLAVVTHGMGSELVAFTADPSSGHPVGRTTLFTVLREPDAEAETAETHQADEEGLLRMSAQLDRRGAQQLLVASHPDRGVTVALEHRYERGGEPDRRLTVYGVAERELFRPGETVEAHVWARWRDAEGWQRVEPGTELAYSVVGPRGDTLTEGRITASALGSGSFSFELPEGAPLGLYQVRFAVPHGEGEQASATLFAFFRVEAFRAPEVEVAIQLDSVAGRSRLVGDTLRGSVEVSYFAGGQVENAQVELIVRRRPFVPWPWSEPGESWRPARLGISRPVAPAKELQRLTLRTDARGVASFEVPTTDDGESEWTYELEARARTLSRQEVTAEKSVTLSRQGYYARLELERRLLAPGDRAELRIHLATADQQPVADSGNLRVTRERWRQIYIHRRRGDEISGEAYRDLPERSLLVSAQSDYYLKEEGFVTEEVLTEEVETGADGRARFSFVPQEAGYYNFNWVSRGGRGQPVVAETTLWVSDEATTEIGYRPGGVELIADPGPHRLGSSVPVLISVPSPNRAVLVSIVGSAWTESFVVRVPGTSELIRFEPTQTHQPNAFITATMLAEEEVYRDDLEILVPPVQQFLDVTITPDADGYEPRDAARFTLEVKDASGQPVATELAFTVSDAALYAIVPQVRQGVRSAFYGESNHNWLDLGGSLQWRRFFRPIEEQAEANPVSTRAADSRAELSAFTGEAPGAADSASARSLAGTALVAKAEAAAELVSPAFVREDLRSTAYWNPRVETGEDGRATVEFTFPDNLTEWRADAVAITADTRVGEATADTTTRLPLIARLQTPRFLTERDEVVLTGTFQNNSEEPAAVRARLNAGPQLEVLDGEEQAVEVPANATRRLEWRARAGAVGSVEVELEAVSGQAGDAIARVLPVVAHGMAIERSLSGRHQGAELRLDFDLPEDAENLAVRLNASPTLATQLFSALPYLIEFPYGSTEQTVGRFLPALAVRRAMRDLGYPLEAIDAEIYGGLSAEARRGRDDLSEVLDAVLAQSVSRLTQTQKGDGSWPWMPDGSSDAYMTAYVVYGLTLAEELGVPLGGIRLGAARDWLERTMTEARMSPAERAWILHALAARYRAQGLGRPSRLEARAFLQLMDQRQSAEPVHLALLALTAKYFGFEEDAVLLLDNLANSARETEGSLSGASDGSGQEISLPQVHWGQTSGYYRWSEGAVETTTMVLQALLAVRPEHRWVEPAATWLVRNRTGTAWQNTRSTALAVLALTDYLQIHESGGGGADWSLQLNGAAVELPVTDIAEIGKWSPPLSLLLPPEQLRGGANTLTLRRDSAGFATGEESLFYFSLHTRFHSSAEPIPSAVSDLAISRQVEHLAPVPTLLNGVKEVMRSLEDDIETVRSGERIEVVLRIETPRDLNYVLIEDVKPAGFEATQQISGTPMLLQRVDGNPSGERPEQVPAYRELRDRQVGFLVDHLPAGQWELRYRLRAEAPGSYHALPARAQTLYLPSVRGNSAEFRIGVESENDDDQEDDE